MAFLCMGVTNACSQSTGSFPVSYDCWKVLVIMGAICFAVSLRTLAGSSSGPVVLFWFRFSNCFISRRGVGVNRGGYLGDGVHLLGKYRTKLVVKGICFIAIIYYWLVVHSKCGNANVFLFICLNK